MSDQEAEKQSGTPSGQESVGCSWELLVPVHIRDTKVHAAPVQEIVALCLLVPDTEGG